jgi:hypothetical protein
MENWKILPVTTISLKFGDPNNYGAKDAIGRTISLRTISI